MDVRSPFFQNIASVLIGVMFLNPIVSTAAELAVDAAAGSNTSLGSAGNGVPIVNIATANGNGLSHNKFTDYNVGQQGLILNNATDKLQNTQLGGYIVGNSNLNGRAASVILNEVNGGSPSQLKGYTEVAGQSAHVIVANPHGITCDGCGFINTPKTTLTTGKPVVENGRLSRYDVDSGEIAIEGQGLNAGNVDQFELITRSAKLNAELQANKLSIIAGRNEVDAQSLAATAKAANGSAQPQLAIDSSALGGMYAGAIRLVGTEQGVGVKLAGDMAASAGDIHIDATGQLTLARTAASGNIDLKAQSISLNDSVYAGQDARVTAADRITVGTSLAAAGNVSLKGQRIYNHSRLEAGVKADGSGNAASQLDIQGGALTNQGEILARGQLSTDLASIDNRHAQLVAIGNAEIKAGAVDNRGGTLLGQQVLSIAGDSLDNRGGTLASNKALTITASADVRNGDNGLILSKADGLSVQAQNLNNAGGTVQANSGDLQARGTDVLDNNGGKILTGAGKVILGASELRNQHGVIEAQGGDLTATTATFDNSQGSVVANSVEITSSTRLNNDHGHIVATQGDLGIKQGEVLNHAGQLSARKNLNIDADSLDNQGGILGGETIDLTLEGLLGNASGLIEAGERLDITTGSLSSAAGKLRALGQSGKSQFTIDGLFNNDSGLVEIGNAQFALSSQGLSNQTGTVRHVGNQGFGLALADAGQAGGSFITNGELSLDVANWSNSSLLQAQKLTLKVGTFTQTATGKLLSVEDIEASGTNWTNDGSIETDGALQLILSGSYQGNGALKSQGDLKLVAASTSLGVDANLRSGGNGTFSLGSSLVNAGQLSAVGNLLLQVASLTNSGTIGSGQTLRIETSTLLNQSGLIFSGSNMALRTNSLTSLYADIYSLGTLSIAKDDIGTQMDLLDNRSGSIESSGDMNLRAAVLNNRKELFTPGKQLTYGNISVVCYDCSGDHHNVDYVASERFETTIEEDSAAARIHSGNNLDIQGGAIANRYSSISANGNIGIVAATLENTGAASGTIERTRRFNTGRVTDGTDERFRANYIFPYNAQPLPKVVPNTLYSWSLVSDIETITPSGIGAPAIIQAGGNVLINAAQSITNASVLTNQAPQAGVAQGVDTQVGGGSLPLVVQLNAQLSPDTTQQAVNPLALPGFSLPQGQNGLFHVNTDPSHPYLIETNPLFASLKGFLNSDYLLSRIGVNSEQTQRRLGDGLYEQRLIQQAIVARTGKRFLDGLTSDEAQFKYLMDNAIASKATLQLAPGVALTAQQVAALTHDIVWMQEQEVNGQKVLVPVLYLAQANDRLAPGGALIQGQDVTLIGGSALKNSGTLRASSNLKALANDISNSGLVQASERLELLATNSIRNAHGGIINGKDVSVTAKKGDISNERTISQQSLTGKGYSQITSVVDKAAGIEATNTLSLSAGRDIQNIGGTLKAGGNATLDAKRDVVIAAAEEEQGQSRTDKRHAWSSSTTKQHGSEIQVGGNLDVTAGNDLAVIASTVKAGGNIDLDAKGDVTLAAAANEDHFYSKSKKVTRSSDNIVQQSSSVQAGGNISIDAGQDLTLVASKVKAQGDVALDAEQDINILSAKDESASFYSKKSKGSFGRSKSKQSERYDSTNVASVIEAGNDLTINTSQAADGSMSIDGGRDVNVIGSQLKAGNDLLVGATGDVAILSGIEEHGSYTKKSKSGFGGFSKSGKSQLQTSATQVASELDAGNDVVIAAGNDIRLRASQASAGNDVELRAGLVTKTGDIDLVSANDTAYSLTQEYKKKTGLSSSGGMLSIASAQKAGEQAQSSTSVGSQVAADRDATLKAAQDINIVGSGVSAGRNVLLDAGRDVNVVAAANSRSNSTWQSESKTGIALSSDSNGVTAFAGKEKLQEDTRTLAQTAAASQIQAGQDVSLLAGRDINQRGSDIAAERDISLRAERDINLDAARESLLEEESQTKTRTGLTVSVSHNYGNTKDAVQGAGQGDNNASKGSSALKAIDAVSQFTSGPSAAVHLGSASQTSSSSQQTLSNRASTLEAGRDISAVAGNALTISGSQLHAGRDISLAGKDVTLDVARGSTASDSQQVTRQGGINGGTAGGVKVGIGASYGEATEAHTQGNSLPTQLQAGRDVNLKATNDLTLIGTQVTAVRNIDLNAGHDLSIRAASNEYSDESKRHSGGGEVGLAVGSDGIGVYASINLGKGQLEREGERQQEAYLYAGDRLKFTSGQDTTIAGATLRGDEVIGRVGGDLKVSSLPDTGKVKGKEFDLSATATIGPAPSLSGSVGYGKTTGKTNWVEEQTSITAKDRLDIRTENHTQLDGALLASDSGNLKLDTGTLGYRDIKGEDKEHGYYLNVGGSYGFSSGQAQSTDGKTVAVQDVSQQGKGTEGSNGWSVSGHDYSKDREQIVRATVGAGEIVVRGDTQTGQDSTAGLNRDVDKAYEITKDEEERTDLFASKSSLEAVRHPDVTLEQWKEGLGNYGRNAVQAFINMELLKTEALSAAENNKLVAALAWAPELLVDAMDAMNLPTLGLFPGPGNYGGLFTQLPVLVTGDLRPVRVSGSFKTENGQLVLVEGKPVVESSTVEKFEGFNTDDSIFTNGIMNSLTDALANGLMQAGNGSGNVDFVLAYNPTHGLIGDLVESAFDKNLSGSVLSGTARNLNDLFQGAVDAGPESLRIYGHSQGGLLTWVAIKGMDFSNVQMTTIQLSGAPVDAIQFHRDADAAGFNNDDQRVFQDNRPDETVFFGLLPKTDTVADLPILLGGNSQYSDDPVKRALGALFTVTSLFAQDSPHSNYSCINCPTAKPDNVNTKIRDIVIKPTLIDSQGNATRLP